MRSKPIVINSPTPAPSPSDVRAASFNEDQVPPENSFLGKYYRPNRNVRTQSPAPVATGGGSAPKAPVVTQAQPKDSAADRASEAAIVAAARTPGANMYTASPTMVSGPMPASSAGKAPVSVSKSGPSDVVNKTGGNDTGGKSGGFFSNLFSGSTVSPKMVEGTSARNSSNTGNKASVSVSKSTPSDNVNKSGGKGGGKKK